MQRPIRLLTYRQVVEIVQHVGVERFMDGLIGWLEECFKKWRMFRIVPRQAFYYPWGVMESMPITDDDIYVVKVVNGHPNNPSRGLLSVVALGVMAEAETGYPVLLCDATLLTAFRTAATSALAAKYLAREDSRVLGILGTGAQSEFQCLAISRVRSVERVLIYDVDLRAMEKFERNMPCFNVERAGDARSLVEESDILVTATAGRGRRSLVRDEWVRPGIHINAVGGDAPGKTELDPRILLRAKIVVEYLEQAKVEGEIQNVDPGIVYAELWELACGLKPGRTSGEEVTVFDSVGIALEDWAALTYINRLARDMGIGQLVELFPAPGNPKNLYGALLSIPY